MNKLKQIGKIYKEIAEEDKALNKDFMSISLVTPIKKKKSSILSLGGIAKGRKIGVGNEREYAKKKIAERLQKKRQKIDKE